jgi:Zn-dependent M28 family amino/carboxypeptidase
VAFDAEEDGLNGARAFVGRPPVPRERIALNINMDMVSRSDKREIFVAGTYHTPSLKPTLEEVAKRAPITVRFGHDRPSASADGVDDWTNQSDHGPFHAAKIPFVYFGVEDHADYHKPTDTAGKIDRGFFVAVAETILDALLQLDAAR